MNVLGRIFGVSLWDVEEPTFLIIIKIYYMKFWYLKVGWLSSLSSYIGSYNNIWI